MEEKWAIGFEAGSDRLTPLFCANAVQFLIRATFIKLLTLEPVRKKINTSCQSFGCITRKPRQQECFFWIGSIDALSLKSGIPCQ